MATNHESPDWVEQHFPAMDSHAHVALRGTADDMTRGGSNRRSYSAR